MRRYVPSSMSLMATTLAVLAACALPVSSELQPVLQPQRSSSATANEGSEGQLQQRGPGQALLSVDEGRVSAESGGTNSHIFHDLQDTVLLVAPSPRVAFAGSVMELVPKGLKGWEYVPYTALEAVDTTGVDSDALVVVLQSFTYSSNRFSFTDKKDKQGGLTGAVNSVLSTIADGVVGKVGSLDVWRTLAWACCSNGGRRRLALTDCAVSPLQVTGATPSFQLRTLVWPSDNKQASAIRSMLLVSSIGDPGFAAVAKTTYFKSHQTVSVASLCKRCSKDGNSENALKRKRK